MKNAQISVGDQEILASQMHEATRALDERRVRELLTAGVPADVWQIDEDGDLPLQVVASLDGESAMSIAKALIEAGADIDFQGDYGCTALARAVEACDASNRADWAMARFLVEAGANTGIANRDGLTPAEFAACNDSEGAVSAMLDAGMPPGSRGLTGPLLWYCAWDNPELVKELLARGASPDEEFARIGQTPLQRAVEAFEKGGSEAVLVAVASALIAAGADPLRIAEPVPECLRALILARVEKDLFSGLLAGSDCDRAPRPL